MRRYAMIGLLLATVACFISSCKQDSVVEPPPTQPVAGAITMGDVPADTGNTGFFTYVRLRDSSLVALSDSTTTNWDLALRATTIRTNSGASGPGQGGAIVLTGTDFDTLEQAPAAGYRIDSTSTNPAIRNGSGNGWYNYNPSTNIVTPIPGVVIILQTADGKYAKIEIKSYYKGAPEPPVASDRPRFYTFRYFYQPNGSRTLR